jgi:MFS transporter, PPP family, 3-phenylpropionic acid transporter
VIAFINSEGPWEAVNNAATYGFGLMVGFFLSGYLYENMDTSFFFIISSLIAIAGRGIFQTFQGAERSARNM